MAKNITTTDHLSFHIDIATSSELPRFVSPETLDVNTSRDENILMRLKDVIQRALNTIKDAVHDAWTQLDRKGGTGAHDRVADSQTSGLLVDFN